MQKALDEERKVGWPGFLQDKIWMAVQKVSDRSRCLRQQKGVI